jgi:hypothetical protein
MDINKILGNFVGKKPSSLLGQSTQTQDKSTFKFSEQLKPVKEFKLAGKPVQVFNNNPIPQRKIISQAYSKIPDNKRVPLQFMTREQYIKQYVGNQEAKNKSPFSSQQKQDHIREQKQDYNNIIGRYTTKKNKYYKPAVVVFNDKSNYKNIDTSKEFSALAFHEFGHEHVEKKGMRMPLMKEELYCDNFAKNLMQKNTKLQSTNAIPTQKKKIISKDSKSKNMAWNVQQEANTGRYVDYISPDEYLKLTSTNPYEESGELKSQFKTYGDKETEKSEPLSKLGEYIKSKDKLVTIPYVGEEAYDHEGRHRAIAAKQSGDKVIPVVRPAPAEWRTQEVFDSFFNKRFPDQDKRYKEVWKKRFDRPFPTEQMDKESTNAYIEVLKEKGLLQEQPTEDTLSKDKRKIVDGFKVKVVDGNKVRKNLDINFTNFGTHNDSKVIPKKEFWIDKERVPNEEKYYVTNMLAQSKAMQTGNNYNAALIDGQRAESKERNKFKPKYSDNNVHKKRLNQYCKGGIDVWLVDGKKVRDKFYVNFTEGGHGYIYSFIPKNEVWIDDDLQEAEIPHVLIHELHERELMKNKGMSYNKAHEESLELELDCRRNKKNTNQVLNEELNKNNNNNSNQIKKDTTSKNDNQLYLSPQKSEHGLYVLNNELDKKTNKLTLFPKKTFIGNTDYLNPENEDDMNALGNLLTHEEIHTVLGNEFDAKTSSQLDNITPIILTSADQKNIYNADVAGKPLGHKVSYNRMLQDIDSRWNDNITEGDKKDLIKRNIKQLNKNYESFNERSDLFGSKEYQDYLDSKEKEQGDN